MIEPARSIPHGVLSGTYIASTPLGPTTSRVYVQDTEGWVVETFWSKGQIRGFQRCFVAKMRTPLAVISWKENEEIRLYSLSVNDQLQEYAYSSRNPMAGWTAGSLPSIPALWGSRLAAVCWEDTGGDIQIRLYYQDQSAVIKELSGSLYQQWRETHSIPSAIWGSGLTAMAWGAVQGKAFRHIRVIFQDNDNNLRQSVFEDDVRQWQNVPGILDNYLPVQNSITSLAQWYQGTIRCKIWWLSGEHFIRFWNYSKLKFSSSDTIPVDTGYTDLCVIQLNQMDENAEHYERIYYQGRNNDIVEVSTNER